MKIVTVVGARPQFVKAAVVSHEIRKNHTEILVHTGQHYDYNMSEQFFDELDIPKPDYNLGISGGTHAEMTGRMMISIENVLQREKPEWLLVYGDTNSTLAAALAAAKLHIRICHVEAGPRTHCLTNPEEINRVCTDHVSSLLLACTENSMNELADEGLLDRAELVGDPMYDAFLAYSDKVNLDGVKLKTLDGELILVPPEFIYLTCHREENTQEDATLVEIINGANKMGLPVIYPVHPRNRKRCEWIRQENGFENLIMIEPVGYLESIALVKKAEKVVTDSGGLQREAFFACKKCVTVLDFVCWPETMVAGRNVLSKPIANEIFTKLSMTQEIDNSYQPFGDGKAAGSIVRALEKYRGME